MTKEIKLFFGKVALAIANPMVRRAMGDHFRHRGAEEVFLLDHWKALYETLTNNSIGMLVTDDSLSDRATAPLVHDIRNGVLHEHPFPVVIMLAHQKDEQHLHQLINCGPDAIVLAPVSITDLFSKIDRFAAGRKPFIIAHDYIGPDRRSAAREGTNQPLIIEPPNPLTEGADPESFQRAIEASTEALKAAQVECSMGQLAWALKSGNTNDFSGLIVALELLIKSTAQVSLQEAAAGMIGAIHEKDMKSIMGWAQKLIAAKKKP